MSKLSLIHFNNQSIQVAMHDGKPYVAMKSIVENIGLDWSAQAQRIKRHAVLRRGVVMITIPSKSGIQELVALPLSMLNGWLFGIDTNRVKPEIRDTLIQYQFECFDVLYRHFMPKAAELESAVEYATPAQMQEVKSLLSDYVKRTQKTFQSAWNDVFNAAGFNKLANLTAEAYPKAVAFLSQGFLKTLASPHIMSIDFDTRRAGEYRVNIQRDGSVRKYALSCVNLTEDIGKPYGMPA
jgi:P22_AR N-terminal domain